MGLRSNRWQRGAGSMVREVHQPMTERARRLAQCLEDMRVIAVAEGAALPLIIRLSARAARAPSPFSPRASSPVPSLRCSRFAARAGRALPAQVEAVRSGKMHLAGVRLLVPHLTAENHGDLLAKAAGRSRRQIEELIATLVSEPASRPAASSCGDPETFPAPRARGLDVARTRGLDVDAHSCRERGTRSQENASRRHWFNLSRDKSSAPTRLRRPSECTFG